MEHRHRQLAARHLVDERRDGRLVVVGRERRRQPQAVRPRRHDRRPPGERRVAIEDLLGRGPGDHEVLEHFARDRELHALDRLRADLERDVPGVVHEHAVAAVGQVERHVLVRLLARGAAVGVPDLDRLAVLHQRAEALAQPVDELADAEVELLVDEGVRVRRGRARCARCRRCRCRPARRRRAGRSPAPCAPLPVTRVPSTSNDRFHGAPGATRATSGPVVEHSRRRP